MHFTLKYYINKIMESTNVSLLNLFYETDSGNSRLESDLVHIINNSIENKRSKTLALGFCGNFLESIYLNELYYAIPQNYPMIRWPNIRPFRTVAVDETALPFWPNTWDCIIAIHFVEFSSNNRKFIIEAFRTLKTGGKLIVIALNKKNSHVFEKNVEITKRVKYNIQDIISMITEEHFSMTNILGINERFRFWPYNFSYNLNWYGEMLIDSFPLLSDVVMMIAEKGGESPEHVRSLDPTYEIS
ncbi:hypothetical protein FACS1894122_01930 [Alphaproteobacteria bacterium]|nr:hypothetical protein FACS1894122_01930 [Alphaproteobacteria bacterium]